MPVFRLCALLVSFLLSYPVTAATAPQITFSVADFDDGRARVIWSVTEATACKSGGAWAGDQPLNGWAVFPLLHGSHLELTCTGPGGTRTAAATYYRSPIIHLAAQSAPDFRTTLEWSVRYADWCTAFGGWSGPMPLSGTQTIAPMAESTSFTLYCQGPGGISLTSELVPAQAEVDLRWLPPEQNADGTPLTDLAGYRLYWGPIKGFYTNHLDIANPARLSYRLSLPSGTHYIALTAVDADGNESRFSNAIVRIVH